MKVPLKCDNNKFIGLDISIDDLPKTPTYITAKIIPQSEKCNKYFSVFPHFVTAQIVDWHGFAGLVGLTTF